MSRVGLVLGGGGVPGAAFHFATLFSLRMATGWDPGDADVIVGTSSGAVVAALTRSHRLSLDSLVGDVHGATELAGALSERIYRRSRPTGVGRWMRHGLLPGLRPPGRRFVGGGVLSGTNADLVLGSSDPLDLVLVIAPMAAVVARPEARFYEGIIDRLGPIFPAPASGRGAHTHSL